MIWQVAVGAVLFLVVALYVVKEIVTPYQELVDSLQKEKHELHKENRQLRDKILADSERPWLGSYPVDENAKGSVYYMDDAAMLRRQQEHDDTPA
jgi:hypothetical protein